MLEQTAKTATGDVPLLMLGKQQCRYPVREDPATTGRHLFCGRPALPDGPYCAHHHALVVAEERRRS